MSSSQNPTLLLIMGSVRAGRRCDAIAEWVHDLVAAKATHVSCEIIDLRDWPLPPDDEPVMPSRQDYRQEHTRAWSAKVAAADGHIIVTPQYNWGYPAPLKNALDHLKLEWEGKPLMIVTYGSSGGPKCAEQLRQVATGLKMRICTTMPGLSLPRAAFDHNQTFTKADLTLDTAPVEAAIDELVAMLAAPAR